MHSVKRLLLVAAAILIPLIGIGIMYAVVLGAPPHGGPMVYGLVMFAMIVIGLSVPYLILKAGFQQSHLGNARQKPLRMSDIPKDQKRAVQK
jgi:hypothetical protein